MIFKLNNLTLDSDKAIAVINTQKIFDDTPRGGTDGGQSKIFRFTDGEIQVTPCNRCTIVQYSGFNDHVGPNSGGDNRARII